MLVATPLDRFRFLRELQLLGLSRNVIIRSPLFEFEKSKSGTASFEPSSSIRFIIHLLDPSKDGRGLLARLCTSNMLIDQANLSSHFASTLPDVDLLILGTLSNCLHGCNPWGLRLTEIHHESGSSCITRQRVRRAIHRYQQVHQRHGK
jgi:hypothetical protein